jgi:hypothetical protein
LRIGNNQFFLLILPIALYLLLLSELLGLKRLQETILWVLLGTPVTYYGD